MKIRRVIAGLGVLCMLYAVAFLVPVLVSLFYDMESGTTTGRQVPLFGGFWWTVPDTAFVFLLTGLGILLLGGTMARIGVLDAEVRNREAYAIVGLGWLLLAALGAIPYLVLGVFTSPVDALFESMSGITTTGATILPEPFSAVPPSLMVWRAMQQWIGGLGIVVIMVALLAKLTQGGMQLMGAETPGLGIERVKPRLVATAKAFWGLYTIYSLVLLAILTVLMHTTGVGLSLKESFFDALVHTFTSLSTGGFSNREESIAYYHSFWVEFALMMAMAVMGISFALHYMVWNGLSPKSFLRGRLLPFRKGTWSRIAQHTETTTYLIVLLVMGSLVSLTLWWHQDYEVLSRDIWMGFLQTVSIVTTTGYTPAVFDEWNDAARFLMFLMFFMGGCAGSTAGAFKMVRTLILGKLLVREMRMLLHPRAFVQVRLGRTILGDDAVKTVAVFAFAYLGVFILGAFAYSLLGMDFTSAVSGSLSGIGNIGPALGQLHADFHAMPWQGRLVHVFLMWVGRLEIFTVLILLYPQTWRR